MGEHDDMASTRTVAATILLASSLAAGAGAQPAPGRPAAAAAPALDALHARVDKAADAILPTVVTWRRDLHAHPELGNHEVRTSAFLAEQLRAMGYDVRGGI